MTHEVVLSYSIRDKLVADAVCGSLEASAITCWIAPRDVPVGMDFSEAVINAIRETQSLVLVLSSNSSKSDHVIREIELAAVAGIVIIPFRIEEAPVSRALEYFIGSNLWVDAMKPPFQERLEELAKIIKGLLSRSKQHQQLIGNIEIPPSAGQIAGKPAPRNLNAPEVSQDGTTPSEIEYNVFICYRRQSGSEIARSIRSELRRQNLRVFLDVDDLRSGHFEQALLKCIADTPNFIVILSPNSLDHCSDERDWLRQEIAQAIKSNRNIIPVMLPGFKFPESQVLPDDVRDLSSHQSVSYSHEFFDAMIARIIQYLEKE